MKIVFCLPGKSFSGHFLKCWTELLAWCMNNGITVSIQQYYSCNIYYVRNLCLGGNVLNGGTQKPFNGQLDYDYMMWIDSDILFTVEQFVKLLSHQKDIVSGAYLMEDDYNYATVENWDEDFFAKNGYFTFLNRETLKNKTSLFPVSYTGFGFILIKKGIFESMEYPWFRPEYISIGNAKDFTMEDVAFCRQANRLGHQILIDPTIILGHEKTRILI
jgi:hypothetical protein